MTNKSVFILTLIGGIYSCSADLAKFTAYVVDDMTGAPISNAEVTAGFNVDIGWKAWTESAPIVRDRRQTGQDGKCNLSGRTNTGRTWAAVEHPPSGYYSAVGQDSQLHFKRKDIWGVWQPDNLVVTIRLQRVEHPIPLKARHAKIYKGGGIESFDGTNGVLRYDLVIGDWLPPEGRGIMADIVIRTHLECGGELKITEHQRAQLYDYTSTIEFPGEGNGLVEKECSRGIYGLRIRMAPEEGYLKKKEIRYGMKRVVFGSNEYPKEYSECNDAMCYCFRVRSRFNEKGELVGAYYGKIYGDFSFFAGPTQFVGANFLYYLNPTPLDRNLEWDRKTNLFDEPNSKRRRRSSAMEIHLP
ncbi:MAG: hypothetical protein IJ146_06020 [Kiritimatiellae bacterium]|nr:hypothetical protein [Kiritimatiellia bacterium]